ncbi:co-chaperone GroES [Patescibacteria group bacterium]|nr:co-chaperone GroES [Patescibacteria group bacterium]
MAKANKNKQNIQPLFDNVLVKPLRPEEKTASGIYLPETAQEKPQMAEVVAVGPGTTDENGKFVAMQVKVGDTVLYKKWGGDEIKIGFEDWILLKQENILAIVK